MSNSSINSSSPPKRRLSLFSFGNKKSSTKTDNDKQQEKLKLKCNDDDKDGPLQLISPSSPLSLTDENLQNLNNITSLPPPSMSNTNTTSNQQHQHQHHHSNSHTHSRKLPSDTMSESSLIFERYVQDPFPSAPQYSVPQDQQQQQQQQVPFTDQYSVPPNIQRQNSFLSPTHLNSENFIPLLIDSTATLIGSNMDLDEVDMIYSPRRSSVLNLSSAFNSPQQPCSRRSSMAQKSPLLDRSNSLFVTSPQQQKPPQLKQRKSTISFLSYADMIQNEEQEQNIPRRPSMSQTLSSLHLSNSLNQRSRNDSVIRTPARQPSMFTNSPSLSRQTSGRNSLMLSKMNTQQQQQGVNQKFQLLPDSPMSDSSDNEEVMLTKPHSRTVSNASSRQPYKANTNTDKDNFSQNIDDVLERTESQLPETVVSNVGDTLRQYAQDIRSS